MAEFCKRHCKEIMGLNPAEHPEWVVQNGFRCEECGNKYMDEVNKHGKT